jgi:hypothetical protein
MDDNNNNFNFTKPPPTLGGSLYHLSPPRRYKNPQRNANQQYEWKKTDVECRSPEQKKTKK